LPNRRRRRNFGGLVNLQTDIYLVKSAPQAKILWFSKATNEYLPSKMSAAGENFWVLWNYKADFAL
tara:strand:+ start:306 stop:503 length:198 start_codon:yes stop_codon:yes gene_type:complete